MKMENMNMTTQIQYTAFAGPARIAAGDLRQLAAMVKAHFKESTVEGILIFEDANAQLVDVDFRGTTDEVLSRLASTTTAQDIAANATEPEIDAPRGPGRPKLGVVAREVTLLPRHWDWLNTQTGGASVALRKLVEEARRASIGRDRIRHAQEASYRFMSATLSNEAGFEEAARALFAGKRAQFDGLIEAWPIDLRSYLTQLAEHAFDDISNTAHA
jgi:hypothetical protein